MQLETTFKNPKLNAIVKAAHKDKASAQQKVHELAHKTTTEDNQAVSKSRSRSSKSLNGKKYSFTTSMAKKGQAVAASRDQKCGLTSGNAEVEDKDEDGKMTVTYTYGYSYIRKDYTSLLVVSIVVIFMLVIVVVELLDKVTEA